YGTGRVKPLASGNQDSCQLSAASRRHCGGFGNSPANGPLRLDHSPLIFLAAYFYDSDRLGGLNRVFSSAQLSLYGTTKNGVTCILLNFPLTVLSHVCIVVTAPAPTRDAVENSLRFEIMRTQLPCRHPRGLYGYGRTL